MHRTAIILLSLFFLNSISLKAQLVANFSANKTQGCAPLTAITLIDQSTPAGTITSWTWIIEGVGTLTGNDTVTINYQNAGTYDVTLIVSNGTTTDTIEKKDYITVFGNPVANFTAIDSTGCVPFTAQFQDLSVAADTNIVSWNWDFFDGVTSNLQNPTHLYPAAGSFTVYLEVTDANGCVGKKTKSNFIQTTAAPKAIFSATNSTISCVPPLTVSFNNTSTGNGLTYIWYFGDGADTALTNPSHTYTDFGEYDVTLVVTDQNGCKDSLPKPGFVRIADVVAGFTMSADTICPNQLLQLTDTSIGATSYQWSSSGGNFSPSSAFQNPAVSYSSAGDKIIQLIAFGPQQLCSDTVTDTVHVEFVAAGFTTNPAYGCEVPLTVQFNDTSINAVSWTWNFGDGSPVDNSENPSHTYNSAGPYNVQLTVVSLHNCTTFISKPAVIINITLPAFTADSLRGCIPLTVKFTVPPNIIDSFASFQWDFGDGISTPNGAGATTITGVLNTSGIFKNPTHVYTTDGDFTVTLITTTVSGCIDTVSYTGYIQAGFPQSTAFSVDMDTACADTIFTFTDETFDPALVDEWQWSIGGYDVNGIPTPPYPGTNFGSAATATYTPTDTGFFYVQLITGYNGCYDTLPQDSFIYVLGPYINIANSFNCDTPFTYFFDTTVFKDVQRFYWNYNDGSSLDSINIDSSHTYANTGDYWVKLSTYNDSNNCKFIDSIQIFVREIVADFTLDTTWGCVPLTVQFNGVSSQDEVGVYQWNFGDSVLYSGGVMDTFNIDTLITHTFAIRGERAVQLIVTDVNGCKDTVFKNIKAYKPRAYFAADTLTGCVEFAVNFTDTTVSDSGVVAWNWNFGEGGITDTNQITSYSYATIGGKTVTLIVTDSIGCKDTLVKSNYIIPLQPTPNWAIADSTICFGSTVNIANTTSYLNSSTSVLNYQWFIYTASDSAISTLTNPDIVFDFDTGLIFVTLIATDNVLGCDSSVTRTDSVYVQAMPVANFSTNKDSLDCYPEQVTFYDASASDYLTGWLWNFGDGFTSTLSDSAIHTYLDTGSFDVQLTVTTSYGCVDDTTYADKIIVTGPQANFSINPDTVCIGEPVNFFMSDTSNIVSFVWDFGDGVVVPGTDTSITYSYNQVGTLFPKLICKSGPLCEKVFPDIPYDDTVKIFIHQVKADFITDTHICRSVNLPFTDASLGANTWNWSFGDGDSAAVKNTSHIYNTEGNYQVLLMISNSATQCKDTAQKTIIVYFSCDSAECNLNPPLVTSIADTAVIIGEEVTLYTTTQFSASISWNPPDSLSCTDCTDPVAQPFSTTTYIVSVKDENDCFTGYDSVTIRIINESYMDVPSAFTPNADNVNDTIFVRGLGIKNLQLFQIYNRWGQLLFETSNIKEGWNGTYKGEPQPPETYVYIVNGITYNGENIIKKGYITLLR